MSSITHLNHRGAMVVTAALALAVGVLLLALGSTDDAEGRGEEIGNGEGDVTLTSIGTFAAPVNVAFAPGEAGRIYVVEQDGIVEVDTGGTAQTFLDITDRTNGSGEQGLLGLAFHPDYQTNDLVYAYYTDADTGDIVVSEFEAADPTNADENSHRQVIRIRHRMAGNHNGGQLQFGPDGFLYLATGDGGGADDPRENAQDKRSLLGKLLRIDPIDPPGERDYTIPAGNPFKGKKGDDEIYARGLRNPFRFTFDSQTGRIAIGDVGQSRFEEVDYETSQSLRNANFGWDRYEGRKRHTAGGSASTPKRKQHDKPIFTYGRNACGGGCAVTGGLVVRDPDLTNLYGRYLFADAYAGRLRSFIPRLGQAEDVKYLEQGSVGFVSSFASDPETDEVYVTDLQGGDVYRLDP